MIMFTIFLIMIIMMQQTTTTQAGVFKQQVKHDWCMNKPINGKYTLAEDCGLHKISGRCIVNQDEHATAICIYNENELEIDGIRKANGLLPRIYRQDFSQKYRLFTLHGGGILKLNHVIVSGGDLTGLKEYAGAGGAIFVFSNSRIILSNSIIRDNIVTAGRGGGLFVGANGGKILMTSNTLIYNNSATGSDGGGRGGGLFCSTGATCVLNTSSQLLNNHVTGKGGGMYCERASACIIVAQSSVSQNVGNNAPSGIFCEAFAGCSTDGTAFVNSPWCLPGTAGNLHGTSLTKDNWETQPKNSGICTDCVPGTYSDTKNAEHCKNCPTETISIYKAVRCEGASKKTDSNVNYLIGDEETLWRFVGYSVGIIVGLFLMYKSCIFCTLKYTGRLNPDMPLWKAYLFTILYGNSNDDHVLPDGQRKNMDVAMNDITNKTTPLLGNEEDVEEESFLGDNDDNDDNEEGETRKKRKKKKKTKKLKQNEQEYTQV